MRPGPKRRIVLQRREVNTCSLLRKTVKTYSKSTGKQLKNCMQVMNEIMRSEFRKRSLWPNVVNRQGTGEGKTQPACLPPSQAKCACPLPGPTYKRQLHPPSWWGPAWPMVGAGLLQTLGRTWKHMCLSCDVEQGTRRSFKENTPEPNYASWFSLITNER